MKLSRVFAVIVAAGSLAAASVRAQDTSSADASSGATSSTQPKARKGSDKSQAKPTPYGEVVNGPSTTGADGIPVANPNPLSVEKRRGELGGIEETPGELTDESNASGDLQSNTDGY